AVFSRRRQFRPGRILKMGCGLQGFRMRLTSEKFDGAVCFYRLAGRIAVQTANREFGLVMKKSPRKTLIKALLAVMVIAVSAWLSLQAQGVPQAPAPKPDATATTPTASSQQSQPQTPPANPPGDSDTRVRIRLNVNLVVLPVTVKDSAGVLVPDLTKEEFRVLDDNVE